jgi:hypothetical protein
MRSARRFLMQSCAMLRTWPPTSRLASRPLAFQTRYSPIRSYRNKVSMFPLPCKSALKYRTREKVGGISILVFNTKCIAVCRPLFGACGAPDLATGCNNGYVLGAKGLS